jgi:hypothetical protein
VYGLRSTSADRSNLAVFNTGPVPVTFSVILFSGSGDGRVIPFRNAETLPPYGWLQYGSRDLLDANGVTNGWVTIDRTSQAGSFSAYGVVNDQVTSDGSYLPAITGTPAAAGVTVPVLVETPLFVSELVLSNRGATPATFRLAYRESLSPSRGAGGVLNLVVPAGQQRILADAIDVLRKGGVAVGARGAASYAGALRVTVSGAAASEVFAGARTAALSPAGGGFGLFAHGVFPGQEASAEAFLFGLVADASNRSNVAVLHAGADGSGALELELQAFDGETGGTPRGAPLTVTLAPGEWAQPSSFFANSGVRNGWVRIRRLSGSAPWIAYGVVNDGGTPGARTNDGAYVPMTKASPESP